MFPDKRTPATIPFRIAAACAAIICILLFASLLGGNPVPVDNSPYGITEPAPGTTIALPACPPELVQARVTPVVPDHRAETTLVLTRPPADDRVPYTARGFSRPVEAAIAWWMSPGFMDNTSEFRGYERTSDKRRQAYPEEHRIFFAFIEDQLDTAEARSVLRHNHILFCGIHPAVAGTVLNTSRYHEPAFASTSYDIALSLDDFGVRSPDGYRSVLVLERDAGDHALYINEDEREYLLPRGSDWTVTRAVSVENLTVKADFPLHGRTTATGFFDHVRLVYLRPAACL